MFTVAAALARRMGSANYDEWLEARGPLARKNISKEIAKEIQQVFPSSLFGSIKSFRFEKKRDEAFLS